MAILAVVNIRKTLEAAGQALSHRRATDKPRAPRIWPTRHVKCAVFGEEAHDFVEVMSIERLEDGLRRLYGVEWVFRHLGVLFVAGHQALSMRANGRELSVIPHGASLSPGQETVKFRASWWAAGTRVRDDEVAPKG